MIRRCQFLLACVLAAHLAPPLPGIVAALVALTASAGFIAHDVAETRANRRRIASR